MQNPWDHDGGPDRNGSIRDSPVKPLAMAVWGLLIVTAVGVGLLAWTGTLSLDGGVPVGSAATLVGGAMAAVVLLPLLLKLLAISRLLATLVFVGAVLTVGRVVWIRESERFDRLLAVQDSLAGGGEAIEELLDLLEILV